MKYKLLEKIPGINWEVGEIKEFGDDELIEVSANSKQIYKIFINPIDLVLLQKTGVIEVEEEVKEAEELEPFSVDNPPKYKEVYWYNNHISTDTAWDNLALDIYRLKTNNCFRTREEAEEAYRKIMG